MGKKKMPQVKKVIIGMRDANGKPIDLKSLNNLGERKIMKLHYHPKAIIKNFEEVLEDYKKNNAPEQIVFLFEDAVSLLKWAEKRINLLPPPEDNPEEQEEKEEEK